MTERRFLYGLTLALALLIQGCTLPGVSWYYPCVGGSSCCMLGIPNYNWPTVRMEVKGQISRFEYGQTVYTRESDEGQLFTTLVTNLPLRLQTSNPAFAAQTCITKGGQFEFQPLTGRGMSMLTDSRLEVLGSKPDRIALTVSEPGVNPYVRPTQTTIIACPTDNKKGFKWRSPLSIGADIAASQWEEVTHGSLYAERKGMDNVRQVVTFTFGLTVRVTDSAADYLVNNYYRPLAAKALKEACIQAAQGNYGTAKDSLAQAKNLHVSMQKLIHGRYVIRSVDDSLGLAERMVQSARSGWKDFVTRELLAAAQDLLLANVTYKAREHALKYNTPIGEIQRKAEELQRFVTTILQPATLRYGKAVESYLEVSTAEELYNLAITHGFGSLLR